MKYLITGGNFNNKGAQAMVYITCSELRKRYPDADIIVSDLCYDGKEKDTDFKFDRIPDCLSARMILGGNIFEKSFARVASLLKGRNVTNNLVLERMKEVISSLDGIFDVSGYCVSNKFSNKSNLIFIYLLKIAKRYNIPIYILPQSFGPFAYKGIVGNYIKRSLKKTLHFANKLFVREIEGIELLKRAYGFTECIHSLDLVLQNKGIDYSLVCTKVPVLRNRDSQYQQMIGIIPSNNNYLYGNFKIIDQLYVEIINHILAKGDKVFLAYHAGDDREMCKRLKSFFADDARVVFDDCELSFYEFEETVKSLKYLISSRYHSIVLAYKQHVPCIIFAWAVKYHELAEFFLQDKYLQDIGQVTNCNVVLDLLDLMDENHKNESKKIQERLFVAQSNTCFNQIFGDNL